MNIVIGRPPLFEEIRAAFPLAVNPSIIFAWGMTIYCSGNTALTRELVEHESVHGFRQGTDIEGWWRRYIAEPKFRLDEEIPAHIAEYKAFCRGNLHGKQRNSRRLYLHHVASRISSELYGPMIRYDDARKLIKRGATA